MEGAYCESKLSLSSKRLHSYETGIYGPSPTLVAQKYSVNTIILAWRVMNVSEFL